MAKKFVSATRYFRPAGQEGRCFDWIAQQLAAGATHVFVAVNEQEDGSGILSKTSGLPENVHIFPVTPWGKFVMPLNALISAAREQLAKPDTFMLISSVEVLITPSIVKALFSKMGESTIAVGASLPGHTFAPGTHEPANGRQVFWNTLALHNPDYLWVTGFPIIGDGIISDPKTAGVEELGYLGLIRELVGGDAYLMPVPGISWDVSVLCEADLAKHEAKMAAKILRPQAQLDNLAILGCHLNPTMIHEM